MVVSRGNRRMGSNCSVDMGFFGVNGRNIWELSQRWGLHNTENALNATELVNFRLCKFHFKFFFFLKKDKMAGHRILGRVREPCWGPLWPEMVLPVLLQSPLGRCPHHCCQAQELQSIPQQQRLRSHLHGSKCWQSTALLSC